MQPTWWWHPWSPQGQLALTQSCKLTYKENPVHTTTTAMSVCNHHLILHCIAICTCTSMYPYLCMWSHNKRMKFGTVLLLLSFHTPYASRPPEPVFLTLELLSHDWVTNSLGLTSVLLHNDMHAAIAQKHTLCIEFYMFLKLLLWT